ncbi:hypothetical protein [Burkholderia anthina]|uniref:hypothetical protein n=1 Tax=Burkholderia anthina TaxID=179879 RepID=UPI00158AD0A6|nr:hypothetical protein [Burkholderia anthina]
MALITQRPVKLHAGGQVTTIDAGKPLPAGTTDRVIKILQAQGAVADVPSKKPAAPNSEPPAEQNAADVDTNTATPAKR